MFDPAAKDERYLHPYQRWYRSSAVRAALREIPARMMLDDHEIVDNWEPLYRELESGGHGSLPRNTAPQRNPEEELGQALEYYEVFQRGPTQAGEKKLWSEIRRKGFELFMLDTRTERSAERGDP